ncbi:MAG: 50S ribosome-binding GTPase [Betaproteobacteria bacterium]|nr:50S ribosome-binding GTPase [Betaproteobacteria bacterium]
MSLLGEIEKNAVRSVAEDRGVLRFITAGSVDDGKSTLIGRLLHDARAILEDQLAAVAHASRKRGFDEPDLSLLTDGLEAEREQGITIDVAYRYFATPRRKFIIADTPGHEQYTRNMATAASTADAAVILVDAGKGLLAQSKRHLLIAHLLGIRNVIVAVNKMDLAGFDRGVFQAVRAAFEEFAAPLAIPGLAFIPVSALRGDMVVERGDDMKWYRGPALLEVLESLEPARTAASLPFRFPVQLVARPGAGHGARGYLGRVASGVVLSGQQIVALPSGRRTVVKDILALEGSREIALAEDSVTLLLSDELDISRGDMLADAHHAPQAVSTVDATLFWLATGPFSPAGRYLLKHTTRTVKAKVVAVKENVDIYTLKRLASGGEVAMNDVVRATLRLAQPVFADAYAENRATGAFILIDEATNQTVAAGLIEQPG